MYFILLAALLSFNVYGSKDSDDACAFKEQLKATTFTDKESALRILKLLEEHQATTESSKKIYAYVIKKGAEVTEDDIDALWSSEKCGTLVAYYANLKRLISNIDTLSFSKEEKTRIVGETLKHVREEVSSPTSLMGALIDTALLKLLLKQNLVSAEKEVTDLLSTIEERGNSLKEESRKFYLAAPAAASKAQTFKELPAEYKKHLLTELKKELLAVDAIRQDILGVVGKIKV
jgi:hypothetical protein